jgi:hypothetical protein
MGIIRPGEEADEDNIPDGFHEADAKGTVLDRA